jgi:hypothetical protein
MPNAITMTVHTSNDGDMQVPCAGIGDIPRLVNIYLKHWNTVSVNVKSGDVDSTIIKTRTRTNYDTMTDAEICAIDELINALQSVGRDACEKCGRPL